MPHQQTHGKFHHFTDALANIQWLLAHKKLPIRARRACEAYGYAVANGQRFYLPDAPNVLSGRDLDAETKSLARLPYDVITVLGEENFTDSEGDRDMGFGLTVAFYADSDFNRRTQLIDPSINAYHDDGFFVMSSVLRLSDQPLQSSAPNAWRWLPTIVFCDLDRAKPGFGMGCTRLLPRDIMSDEAHNATAEGMLSDISAVLNLCAMLSLHNVTTTDREPPPKVQSKRQSRGKQPLYSYKVLTVDGQSWDTRGNREGDGTGPGVRSHMRRGHIRRLDGGARRIWVRSTYVHGSVPGFVDKDYQVKAGLQALGEPTSVITRGGL